MTHDEFEIIVMNKLLEGDDELFTDLRSQYLSSKIVSREFTGCGFFTSFEVLNNNIQNHCSGKIDDVRAKLRNHDGEYLFFILYISNGRIDTLECFTTMDNWNYDYDNAIVEHCYKGKRVFDLN